MKEWKESEVKKMLEGIRPLDQAAMSQAKKRWSQVAKPLNSLGILEEDIIRIAGIQESHNVDFGKKGLLILCGDNGIVEEGVTQTGQEVTGIVTENMTRGDSCVCLMAKKAGVNVFPVDVGTTGDLVSGSTYPLINRKIARGTRNFLRQPAMTREQVFQAIGIGIDLAGDLKAKGYGLLATGEMGIGNTTTSSAVCSLLLNLPVHQVTGRGAGLSDQGLARKIQVIEQAVEKYGHSCRDGGDVLSSVGGFDLAAMAGVFLGGAIWRIPVLVDGFISAVAALAAKSLCPLAPEYMVASHGSSEPAGLLTLNALGLKPLIQAGMCLGEGTGAVAAVPLLEMALEVYRSMSTFDEIQVEPYEELGGEK